MLTPLIASTCSHSPEHFCKPFWTVLTSSSSTCSERPDDAEAAQQGMGQQCLHMPCIAAIRHHHLHQFSCLRQLEHSLALCTPHSSQAQDSSDSERLPGQEGASSEARGPPGPEGS